MTRPDGIASTHIIGWLLVPLLLVAGIGAWLALDPGFRLGRLSPDGAANLSQDAFGQRVREYLLENPEVIMEAVRRLEARQQEREESEAQNILKARADDILRDATSPVGGNPQGDVSLVEFFDYNCPYCRSVAPIMADAEAADPQLRIVYKEYPILGPNSTFAAKAALAVHRQGKYVAFHQALMQVRGTVDDARVLDVAGKIGVDVERMKTEMNDPAIQAAIDKNLALAQALRINGTPGFVVGEQILRGATDLKTLRDLIREARSVRN
jgi:protein-disulfide isomerase